ncbi:hypothetical protein ACQKJG_18610 [Priestia megaterium]|uniref:hypothetical protein n=1 Tax=Priestia megaterium TaxID=1404 RepID=UPI003D053D5E
MITIPEYKTTQASRVYGDFTEKVAFNVSIDPTSVLSSIAGGYAATHVYNKKRGQYLDKKQAQAQQEEKQNTIEKNPYSQVEDVLKNLKIVFTPINVLYTLNGQAFDIIQADEMTPQMKQAFVKQDGDYFRNLLVNKMNMEIQLAEKALMQRLIAANGYGEYKEATFSAKQDLLTKVAEEEFEPMVKTASEGLEGRKLNIPVNFNDLRPFNKSAVLLDPRQVEKVAGVFDLFQGDDEQQISVDRLNNEINVGFLPDRVVYLWNGQLIEQLTLLHMNEEGYEAFKNQDKEFFIDFFRKHTKELSAKLQDENESFEQQASFKNTEPGNLWIGGTSDSHGEMQVEDMEEDEVDKEAAALEDIVDDIVEDEFPVIERDDINVFEDADIHPLVYDRLLTSRYGKKWSNYETEALLKQLELDFDLKEGLSDNPLNKISILRAISSPEHAMYQTPLTFEKFMRGMNSKSVLFDTFQGNLAFEEIVFGLEVAKAYDGDEVFLEFHDKIAPYVSEELMNANVRFVSQQLFDEDNPSEKEFYDRVNSFLMRKWKERDASGLTDDKQIETQHIMTEQITEIVDDIISNYAEQLEPDNPYVTTENIINKYNLTSMIPQDNVKGVINMVKETVVAHLMTAIFVEYKHQEFDYLTDKLEKEGVIRESK